MNQPSSTAVTFVPDGVAEFGERAKRLAAATGLRLSKAQDALARIYGHDGHAAALRACRDVDEGIAQPTQADGLTGAMPSPDTDARTLAVLVEAYGGKAKGWEIGKRLPPDVWRYRDLALFGTAAQSRTAFLRMKARLEALAPGTARPTGHVAADYAYVVYPDGEAALAYTPLGRGIADAIDEVEQRLEYGLADPVEAEAALLRILQRHPRNPWAATHWVANQAAAGDGPQAPEWFLRNRADRANEAVRSFESLYGDQRSYAPPKLLTVFGPDGGDSSGYYAALCHAGRACRAAGDSAGAEASFRKALAIDERDGGGVRFLLEEAGAGAVLSGA